MVTIRFSRGGSKHAPFYHLVVTDSRSARDGRFIEKLGYYNPLRKEEYKFDNERIAYWQGVGAQMSLAAKKVIKQVTKNEKAQ